MSKAAPGLRDSYLIHDQPSPAEDEIRCQLQAILASPAFHGSKRCQQFLEYVCDKSLRGENGALKERIIATRIFGRQPESDLGEDTIVRVSAREVRKRLAQYHVSAEGAASPVRIDLPSGSYVPEFRYALAHQEDEPPAAVPVVVEKPARPRSRWLVPVFGAMGLAGLIAVGVFALSGANPNADAFQHFWAPVLRGPEPLLVAVAHPIVYHASNRAVRLSEENQPPQDIPFQRPVQVAPEKLNGSDLVPVFNQYVGFGDLVAATEVSSMLARKSRSVRVRLASAVEFADLRKAQTLLIGAVTNRWTMELQQAWRFRFAWTPGTRIVIVDTADPAGAKQWTITSKNDGSALEDYILVSRIRSTYTGGLVMVAAGLKQFGTEAAGRLLADSDQLGLILRQLPQGWEAKSLQVVLHARVIGNTPAQPEVVASYVW